MCRACSLGEVTKKEALPVKQRTVRESRSDTLFFYSNFYLFPSIVAHLEHTESKNKKEIKKGPHYHIYPHDFVFLVPFCYVSTSIYNVSVIHIHM